MIIRPESVIPIITYWALQVRYARRGKLNQASIEARKDLEYLCAQGFITHAEHVNALRVIDNAFSNRLYEGLPWRFRQQLLRTLPVVERTLT